MTNEEKRIKLAERLGWKRGAIGMTGYTGEAWFSPSSEPDVPIPYRFPPNYFAVRDAVIPLIETLNPSQMSDFAGILMERTGHWPCGVVPDYHADRRSVTGIVCSSAEDLANSLGITLGLWTAED
jgi:hypothetical protein